MATADGDWQHDGTDSAYETRHDVEGPTTLGETVIEAVAAAKGVDPTDSDLELYETVDIEALDVLFERRSSEEHWRFEFSIDGYLVVVEGCGTVTVYEQ